MIRPSIAVHTDAVDPETRRRHPVDPYAILRVPTPSGKAIREVPVTAVDLVDLIESAATALRRLDGRRGPSGGL